MKIKNAARKNLQFHANEAGLGGFFACARGAISILPRRDNRVPKQHADLESEDFQLF